MRCYLLFGGAEEGFPALFLCFFCDSWEDEVPTFILPLSFDLYLNNYALIGITL